MKTFRLNNILHKNFSIIHNYHSPPILYVNGREIIHDDSIKDYNKYIQAFLTRRFTHKKEIFPKIKIIPNNKEYHNTFYIQKTYPVYNIYDISQMRYLHNLKIYETGYIISRFFEEWEKPMYDEMLNKVILSGRVPFHEDYDSFQSISEKVNKLISVFYNGDELSPYEREIERAYLHIKQESVMENTKQTIYDKKFKLKEIFLTYSEQNKLCGHTNFRMISNEYFFRPAPNFEKVDIDLMFNTLYEIRYNSINPETFFDKYLNIMTYFRKLSIKYQYRKSLLKGKQRIEFISEYILKQFIQYIDSFEFHNEFSLSLNFRISYNILILHIWMITQRLKKLNTENGNYLLEDLVDKLIKYSNENIKKFQLFDTNEKNMKIRNMKRFILKTFDTYTFHFDINPLTSQNYYENMINLISYNILYHDKRLLKKKYYFRLVSYVIENYRHINTKSYEDIEKCDFWFTVHRIPFNYSLLVQNNDNYSLVTGNYFNMFKTEDSEIQSKLINSYNKNKNLLNYVVYGYSDEDIYKTIINRNKNGYMDKENLAYYDVSKTKSYKWFVKYKREYNIDTALMIGKAEEDGLKEKKLNLETIWDNKYDNSDMGLGYLDKIKDKRKNMLNHKKDI